jgi:uncharacterized membrane protein
LSAADANEKRWLDVSRIVFFNDAIFAIAMTVLVLGFRVPEGLSGESDITDTLSDQFDHYVGYFLSFLVLGYYWLAHHRLFDHVRRADRWVLYLNLVFLAFIGMLPYPAELLQHHSDTEVAVTLWSATIAGAGIAFTALIVHAGRGYRLMDPPADPNFVSHAILREGCVPVVFLVSIAVAVFSVDAAKFVWLAVIPCHFMLRRRFGSIHDAH